MTGQRGAWVLAASIAAVASWGTGCELVVGPGNYSSGGDDGGDDAGGGNGSSSGGSSSGSSASGSASGGSSGSGSGAASSGSGSSSGSSSGRSGSGSSGSGGSSSGATDTAAPFVGTWSFTFVEGFSGCSDSSDDGDSAQTTTSVVFTEVAPNTLSAVTGSGCTFSFNTTSGSSDYLAHIPAETDCAVTTSGVTTTSMFTMFIVSLPQSGGSATVTALGTATVTPGGVTCSHADIVNGTATKN